MPELVVTPRLQAFFRKAADDDSVDTALRKEIRSTIDAKTVPHSLVVKVWRTGVKGTACEVHESWSRGDQLASSSCHVLCFLHCTRPAEMSQRTRQPRGPLPFTVVCLFLWT